jgi:UDP:flavonoid glycosyltransferase YjiC (YdhE family)
MSFVREHGTLFIHHGGHGTCLASVQFGLPSLVIPTFAERAYNAENLAALGCAKVVHLSQLTQRAIRESIEELMNERRYNEKAKHWQAELERRKYGGAQAVADAIASVLRSNS